VQAFSSAVVAFGVELVFALFPSQTDGMIYFLFSAFGLMALLLWAFGIDTFLPAHLKRYSFILAISVIGLLLYYATYRLGFYTAQSVVYVGGLFVLLQDLYASRGRKLSNFLFENKILLMSCVIWLFVSITGEFTEWDEFSWGMFVKHLNQFGTYWTPDSPILGQHLRYFPGLSLWENFFLRHESYAEGPLYFALGLIFIACLVALWPKSPSAKRAVGTFFLFVAVITWFSNGIRTVYVDAPMGLLMGLILLAIHDSRKPWDLIVPLGITVFFTLSKETALILVLPCLALMALKIWLQKEWSRKWMGLVILGMAVIYLNYFLWKKYLLVAGIWGVDPQDFLQKLMADAHELSGRTRTTLDASLQALFSRPFPGEILSGKVLTISTRFVGSLAFWTLLFSGLLFAVKQQREYLVAFLLGLFAYTSFLIFAYLYFFNETDGPALVCFERYSSVYFLAFAILGIKLISDHDLFQRRLLAGVLIAVCLIYRPEPKLLGPGSWTRSDFKTMRADLRPLRDQIIQSVSLTSKVWFIWQNSTGIEAMIMRYEIAPRKMNSGDWSMGDPYYGGDIWTENHSLEKVVQKLRNFDYMAMGRVDEKFTQRFGVLFETPPRAGILYRKIEDKEQVKLVEVR
jgi:hypothetical protein